MESEKLPVFVRVATSANALLVRLVTLPQDMGGFF